MKAHYIVRPRPCEAIPSPRRLDKPRHKKAKCLDLTWLVWAIIGGAILFGAISAQWCWEPGIGYVKTTEAMGGDR